VSHARPSVTADIVVVTVTAGGLAILLVRRGRAPFRGTWALPGGFVGIEEGLEAAAARELAEETGLRLGGGSVYFEQLATYGEPGRDPRCRVISVAYLVLVPGVVEACAGDDATEARLWPVAHLPELAFDHARIVADAVERVRAKLEYTDVALAFVGETFTLAELKRVYEAAWGRRLEPKSFRRKVEAAGLVTRVEARQSGVAHRPATYFRATHTPGNRVLYPPFRPAEADRRRPNPEP